MHPDLFSIGPLTIHTYGLFVALGVITGILIAVKFGKSSGIAANQIMDMCFMMVICGIIGSRLAYVVINFSYYMANPIDTIKLWQGGLVFSGGLIAVILVSIWYGKRHDLNIWVIGDTLAPAAAIGQAIGRIGCFMAGCCYGKPTDMMWGVVFTDPRCIAKLNIPLHPTQLYSSLSGLIIFIILVVINSKKKFNGQVLLWFLILHSTGRLLIERFRGDDRGFILANDFTATQLVTLVVLIAAVVTLFIIKPGKREKK
jgi:phosphatidylglycerol:prolipoprotein diacylglycerol transferase